LLPLLRSRTTIILQPLHHRGEANIWEGQHQEKDSVGTEADGSCLTKRNMIQHLSLGRRNSFGRVLQQSLE